MLISRNHEEFAKDCVVSIHREFGNSIKILNLDIGSTDNTAKILADYGTELKLNIDLIKLSTHTKTLSAVKFATGHIDTKFIILLSCDDALGQKYGDATRHILTFIQGNYVCNFRQRVSDSTLNSIKIRDPKWANSYKRNRKKLLIGNPGTTPGAIIPWEMLKKINAWNNVPDILIEDYWLWWKLLGYATFVNINYGEVLYRRHNNNVTAQSKDLIYSESLGYASALAWVNAETLFEKILSLSVIVRWIRHIDFREWKYFIIGYRKAII